MTQATEKMVERGHLVITQRRPLRLQPTTEIGARYMRDTKVIGIAGYDGRLIEIS